MKSRLFILIFAVITFVVVSCNKEESYNTVRIDSVMTNQVDTVTHSLSTTFLGTWIRVQGTGFTGLQKVLCNGYSVYINSNYVTDNSITFQMPSSLQTGDSVKIDSLKNTIKVITTHGSATYSNFIIKDKNKLPAISSVSYTLPNAGDYIYIYGKYLGNIVEVDFPATSGRIPATSFTIVSNTVIKAQVPSGVGPGAIKIVNNVGDKAFSPSYMFYTKNVFLHCFKESAAIAGGYSGIGFYNAASLASLTGLAVNPDSAISIPQTAANVVVATNNDTKIGYLKFATNIGFQNVINNGAGVTGSTSLSNLAIQFDLYMNQPWKSGAIALRMNKNVAGANASYVYNVTSWTIASPVTFDKGWMTITVPFSSFTGLSMGTLSSYISNITTNSIQSLIGFFNYDENADGHTPSALTNFQMFVANVRLVPTTVPTN